MIGTETKRRKRSPDKDGIAEILRTLDVHGIQLHGHTIKMIDNLIILAKDRGMGLVLRVFLFCANLLSGNWELCSNEIATTMTELLAIEARDPAYPGNSGTVTLEFFQPKQIALYPAMGRLP